MLKKDYYEIYEPTQLGDLVLVTTPDEKVVHAAAYIADDIVFTENGHHPTQPWVFMHLSDMVEAYAAGALSAERAVEDPLPAADDLLEEELGVRI